ncbi:unnamed protein product [Closterium sp. Naga37s-1]|nr:unnamed protein product [Closterium sp. Naga37s-1]
MDTRPKPVDAASAQLAIATFFHVCRIAPNVVEHDAFKTMLKKVAAAGTGFTPPGRRLIMGRLLEECKANTDNALKEVKDSWKDVGVCIACDGWTDSKGRLQLNFLAVNAIASVFLFGVDCGTEKKGAEFIAGHLKTAMVMVGTENVVGLLMDGASANVNAASIIALDYPKVQWIRCAAHSLNLMMKDIGQLDWAKDTIDRAQQLISTLKNAHWITGVLRKEKALQILKPAGTRFGTNYIALERLQAVRKTLDKLVLSEDWEEYVKGKPKMKDAWDTIIDKEFWARVGTVLDVLRPVYKLLRNVDGNQEVMGKIYDKMFVLEDAVKEACNELTEEEKEDVTDIGESPPRNPTGAAGPEPDEPLDKQVARTLTGRSRGAGGYSMTRSPPETALGEDRVGRMKAMTEAAEAATSGGAATGWEAEGELAAETATASGGDSASHRVRGLAVMPLPEIHGRVEEQERATEATEVTVPAPRAQTVVMTDAAVGADVGPVEGGAVVGVGSAETPAAAVGADTQGCDQVVGDTRGRGNGVAAHATLGKGRKKFRAQPAPRRPGAGLVPGHPGPLLGWLLQGQPPKSQLRQPPSVGSGSGRNEGETGVRQAGILSDGAGNIPPDMAEIVGDGAEDGAEAQLSGEERHWDDYVAEASQASETISLEEEGDVTRRVRGRVMRGRNPQDGNHQEEDPQEGGETGAAAGMSQRDSGEPKVQSPADLAANGAIWQLAGMWELAPLQRGDQPFLVRRMPPKILESYTLCILAPLLRLAKHPDCPGAWAILQFLPRLTLQPLPEPVEGSRWTGIEGRLHQFQQGRWGELFEEAKVIPDIDNPTRHQADEAGPCARADGLMKKGNISKAVAALRTTPLAEATPTTLAALQAKHPDAALPTSPYVTSYTLSALRVTPDDLREILKRCPNEVGAGPSGTCFEHLKDPALASEEVLILLAKTVSHLLSTFQTQAVREVLLPSRLIALENPGGGVRPIAIGEAMLRIVAKAALKELSQNIREFFLPVQFGVSVTGGAECIIHADRSLLKEDETHVALQLDIENAFNSVERPAFFQALSQSNLSSLLPLVRTMYEGPSRLLVDHRLGVDQS